MIRYRASRYLARLPSRTAEAGSLALCAAYFLSLPSDPAVTSNALAIRIVFPLIRVTPASCNRPGLPAPLGKPKKGLQIKTRNPFDFIGAPRKIRTPGLLIRSYIHSTFCSFPIPYLTINHNNTLHIK